MICGAASIHGKRTEQQDRFSIHVPPPKTTASVPFKNLFQSLRGNGASRFVGVFDGHMSSEVVHHLHTALPAAFASKASPFHHLPVVANVAGDAKNNVGQSALKESVQRICLELDHSIVWPSSLPRRCVVATTATVAAKVATTTVATTTVAAATAAAASSSSSASSGGATLQVEAPRIDIYEGGSTANFCLLHPNPSDDRIILANVGDSRSIFLDTKSNERWGWRQTLADHTPKDAAERSRITSAGAEVEEDGNINGILSTSRSFGDKSFKRYNIWGKVQGSATVGEPDLAPHFLLNPIQQPVTANPDVAVERWSVEHWLLFVTDGITCVFSNEQITQFLRLQSARLLKTGETINSMHLAQLARRLCLAAIGQGSKDNCTAILLRRPSTGANIKTVQWANFAGGPYYDLAPSFHDAFVGTARLFLPPLGVETAIKQLIVKGKEIAAQRASVKRSSPTGKGTSPLGKRVAPPVSPTVDSNPTKKLCIATNDNPAPLAAAAAPPSLMAASNVVLA